MIDNVKILVVEDEDAVRNFTANALSYCVNREVKSFRDGEAAWAFIENGGEVDMVVSDVDMPGLDGLGLLSRVRRILPGVIFILMSGEAANNRKAESAGADAFLAKPFAVQDLFDIVQTYIVD